MHVWKVDCFGSEVGGCREADVAPFVSARVLLEMVFAAERF